MGPQGPTGATGERGSQGERGADGASGHNHTDEIATLKAQMDQVVKELQTQLTRIAQMQAQLDHATSGQRTEPKNRRSTDSTEH